MAKSAVKISEELNKMIQDKILKVNDRLPSEFEMAKYFEVSRETYRSAVKLLEKEGKLQIKHGVGTFVIEPLPHIENRMDKLDSIGNMIKKSGFTEEGREETVNVVPAHEEIGNMLGVDPGTKLIKLERYRIVDGEAAVYSINYMPYDQVGKGFEENKFEGSLFAFLKKNFGITVACADTEFLVADLKDSIAKKINKMGQKQVVLLKQLHYTDQHVPVLYSYDYLRSDIFKFSIRRIIE